MELTLQTVPLEGGVGFIYLFRLRQLLEKYKFFKNIFSEIRQFTFTLKIHLFFRVIAGIFSASPSAYFLRIQNTFISVW